MQATRLVMLLAAALLSSAGCANRLKQVLLPEVRPDIRLTHAKLAPPTANTYAYAVRWAALDPARRISHYLYAIDPISVDAVDATWVRTTATSHVLAFPRAAESRTSEPHVFVVRAVDDRGEMSDPRWFAFNGDNLPPIVQITNPMPSNTHAALVLPDVMVEWDGTDPDGQQSNRLVRYVYRLFSQRNPDFPAIPDFIAFALTQPDSLRALYAPGFADWASVSGDTTWAPHEKLTPQTPYLFVVTGFDEVGDYDPVFSASKNMLRMNVVLPGTAGPILTMFNEYFHYTYPSGGWSDDASRRVSIEVPADLPVTIRWTAEPSAGATISGYRWALDPLDLADETPRSDEATDPRHWSTWSATTTSATVGPFKPLPNSEFHLFYIETKDSNGLRSLGIVNLRIVHVTLEKALLIVDDTRLRPDYSSSPGTIDPPGGPWPTAAELDTFLYAKGGFPWKGYPAGIVSQPGIFNGYDYDTLGTRGISLDGTVPLSLLGRYRRVLWLTDEVGGRATGAPSDHDVPSSALRLMSWPGQVNTLAAYVRQGGQVWLCGGGAAFATLVGWNRSGTTAYEYTARDFELVPGRMMYDLTHWREGVLMLPAVQARRFGTTTFGVGTNRPGRHWPPNPIPPTPLNPPDYTLLPALLQPKTPATDPMSPWAPTRPPDANYYRGNYMAEAIHRATFIREDYNDDPEIQEEFSTLDTLYITAGGSSIPNSPVMTYYHGRDNAHFVFSGFNVWYWRRTQCIGLVDWVLQQVWGLPRYPAPREPTVISLGPAVRSSSGPSLPRRVRPGRW